MALHRLLAIALLISACASTAPPSLRATMGPTRRPCPACAADQRCGDAGVCVSARVHATALPAPREMTPFDAALAAREQERVGVRRRIRGSRIALIVGSGVMVTGAIILVAIVAAGRPKNRYDDGNDGFEFLYGAIPTGAGALTMIASGAVFLNGKHRLAALAEARRPTVRVRPSLSVGPQVGRAGLVLDLRF